MAQAVHDFRSIVDYLRHTGVDRIALTGISLGGYTSALVASVDDRLEAVIPNCPVVTPSTMFDEWFPANKLIRLGLRLSNISRDELTAGLSYHCPLNYRPLLPKDRRMIITGLGDRMAPPDQAVMLWEHWNHCALHWFPGQPRHAREPAGLPAPDDGVPAGGYVLAFGERCPMGPARRSGPAQPGQHVGGRIGVPVESLGGQQIQRHQRRPVISALRGQPGQRRGPPAAYRSGTHRRPRRCCAFRRRRSPAPCRSRAPDATGSRPTFRATRRRRGTR